MLRPITNALIIMLRDEKHMVSALKQADIHSLCAVEWPVHSNETGEASNARRTHRIRQFYSQS